MIDTSQKAREITYKKTKYDNIKRQKEIIAEIKGISIDQVTRFDLATFNEDNETNPRDNSEFFEDKDGNNLLDENGSLDLSNSNEFTKTYVQKDEVSDDGTQLTISTSKTYNEREEKRKRKEDQNLYERLQNGDAVDDDERFNNTKNRIYYNDGSNSLRKEIFDRRTLED